MFTGLHHFSPGEVRRFLKNAREEALELLEAASTMSR